MSENKLNLMDILRPEPNLDQQGDAVDSMLKEHEKINEMGDMVRERCLDIMHGEDVDEAFLRNFIRFARDYADHLHHGKEEKILFPTMTEELGLVVEPLINTGMMVDHDFGRYHIAELETALNNYLESGEDMDRLEILTHACGWADLLARHTNKENMVVYQFARRALARETMDEIYRKCREFDDDPKEAALREEMLELMEDMRR